MSQSREEALQQLLPIVFEFIENGRLELGNVPNTVEALRKVKRLPDGSFDVTTVEAPVAALCWAVAGMADQLPPPDWVPLAEFPEIELPDLDKRRENDEDYLVDLVEAANNVRKYLIIVASLWPTATLDPLLRSVLFGHAVRIYKLYEVVGGLLVEDRGEVAMAVVRMLSDTVINATYFLKNPTRQVIERYVRQSLAIEKKLMDEIDERKRQPPLPIEEDMLGSIHETFQRAGFDPEDIQADEWRGTSSFAKAKSVGLETLYEFVFRPASHYVHGTWHDLEWNHLQESEGQLHPRLRFTRAVPQILEMATVAALDTALRYVEFMCPQDAGELVTRLNRLKWWFVEMSMRREGFRKVRAKKGQA